MKSQDLCHHLQWDSDFFGYKIGRVNSSRLDQESIVVIDEWCLSNSIDCLYFLGEADDPLTVRIAEDHGFRFLDIRVTLENKTGITLPLNESGAGCRIRRFSSEDLPALKAMAQRNHRYSRFYFDSNFPVSCCDALYEKWIEKSCDGYAQNVLVAEIKAEPVGYLSCHLLSPNKGKIGLFGVDEKHQGQGIGQMLIDGSLKWFAKNGADRVAVATQGRNIRVQRLYQRRGFQTKSTQLWYHKWFERA
jgi:Acetyltransferases